MITAKHISDWAVRAEAQRELPRLIRKLISGTASLTQIVMPAGDSVSTPGFDGDVYSEVGNAWVPKGHSCWEISCNHSVKTKANNDYNKRCDELSDEDKSQYTYVALTARKWAYKLKWAAEKKAERKWQDVRAYDADDIEHWLEETPAIALQFAEQLGLVGEGVTSPSRYFSSWSNSCQYPISAEVLLTSREQQISQLSKKIEEGLKSASTSIIRVRADSAEEAVAFVAAVINNSSEIKAEVHSLIVTEKSGWRFVEKNIDIHLAVAVSPELAEQIPRRAGLIVIIPYARGDVRGEFYGRAGEDHSIEISLNRPDFLAFEDALKILGVEQNDSTRISVQCGRSWSIFRRIHSKQSSLPEWIGHPTASTLSIFCLVGAWFSDKAEDKAVVERITGRQYEDIERDLLQIEQLNDSPVLRIGKVWKAKSTLELLYLYGGKITEGELDRFFTEVKALLSVPDPELELPKSERYLAAVKGKVREVSGGLLRALSDTLIKLSVKGEEIASLKEKGVEQRVANLVRDLLHGADRARWLSLSAFLPALAEASPNIFLNAVEDSLKRSDAAILHLFLESQSDINDFYNRRWYYAPLLWALEVLAWAPQWLTRVSLILARLIEEDVPHNGGNSPFNTLSRIFLPWLPQTSAQIQDRIVVVDQLVKFFPDTAYKLFDFLSSDRTRMTMPIVRPKWRDDDSGAGYGVAQEEIQAMFSTALDRQFILASLQVNRVVSLIEKYNVLDDEKRTSLLEMLVEFRDHNDDDKEIIREKLRHILKRRGRKKPEEKIFIKKLEEVYERLCPVDLVKRDAWLFKGSSISFFYNPDEDYEENEKRKREACIQALEEVFEAEGWPGIEQLAGIPEIIIGDIISTLADLDINIEEAEDWVIKEFIESQERSHKLELITGVVRLLIHKQGNSEIQHILKKADENGKSLEWKVSLLVLAQTKKEVWLEVEKLGSVAQSMYWQYCIPRLQFENDIEFRIFFIEQLIEAKRPATALKACYGNFSDIPPDFVASMLEGVMFGVEKNAALPKAYYIQEAIKYLEKNSVIAEDQLIRIELGLFGALQPAYPHIAETLYHSMMTKPEIFVDLLCILYKPRSGTFEDKTKASEAILKNICNILRFCSRQPGTQKDGNLSKNNLHAFVVDTRNLALQCDRLEVCDIHLGEIIARGTMGSDGIFPYEEVRDLLEELNSEEIFRGLTIECINKRGATIRGMAEGGEQERELVSEYRAYAQALEITHPYLSAALEEVASEYERQAHREDIDADLRREER